MGWAAVEKAVREDDEQQVRSCKEDIDTLLTFVSYSFHSSKLTKLSKSSYTP